MVEKGTHQELLALKGRYAAMWEKHCRAERAAEQARDATRKAKKLLCQAKLSRPDEISDGYNSMLSSTVLPTAPHSPTTTTAEAHDTESISSESGTSSSGSDGTLQDEACDERRHEDIPEQYTPDTEAENPDDACRPHLYSFPSQSSAGRSTDASRSPRDRSGPA